MSEELTDAEALRLQRIHAAWTEARAAADWHRADRLRAYLQRAGCTGPDLDRWHPVFEDGPHRRRRIVARSTACISNG